MYPSVYVVNPMLYSTVSLVSFFVSWSVSAVFCCSTFRYAGRSLCLSRFLSLALSPPLFPPFSVSLPTLYMALVPPVHITTFSHLGFTPPFPFMYIYVWACCSSVPYGSLFPSPLPLPSPSLFLFRCVCTLLIPGPGNYLPIGQSGRRGNEVGAARRAGWQAGGVLDQVVCTSVHR